MKEKTIYDLNLNVTTDIFNIYQDEGGIASMADLEKAASAFRNNTLEPAIVQASVIVSGDIAPERDGRFTYLSVDTEGQAPISDLVSISNAADFSTFDLLYVKNENAGRVINVIAGDPSLIINNPFTLEDGGLLILCKVGDSFVEISRYPGAGSNRWIEFEQPQNYGISGGAVEVAGSVINLLPEKTGGTAATFSFTVSGAGASGSAEVVIIPLAGQFSIGKFEYTGSPTNSTVATGIKDAINALTGNTGYTATNPVPTSVQVTMPITLGTVANSYGSDLSTSGGFTYSGLTQPSGAVDQTEQATLLNQIDGLKDNSICFIANRGTKDITLAHSPGSGIAITGGSSHVLSPGAFRTAPVIGGDLTLINTINFIQCSRNFYDLNGTCNGIVVSGPISGHIIDNIEFTRLDTGARHGITASFQTHPQTIGSTVEIRLIFGQIGTDTGNVRLHTGVKVRGDGDDFNDPAAYVTGNYAAAGVTGTAQLLTITHTVSALAPDQAIFIYLFREGDHISDTCGDHIFLSTISIVYSIV